jgi:hypothetical protein
LGAALSLTYGRYNGRYHTSGWAIYEYTPQVSVGLDSQEVGDTMSRIVALSSVSLITADAWEATYPTGPIKKEMAPFFGGPEIAGVQPLPPVNFQHLKAAYPADEGAVLGLGWDFFQNKKVNSRCITGFDEKTDRYQTVPAYRTHHVIDQETLDVSLNSNFTGSARGVKYQTTPAMHNLRRNNLTEFRKLTRSSGDNDEGIRPTTLSDYTGVLVVHPPLALRHQLKH